MGMRAMLWMGMVAWVAGCGERSLDISGDPELLVAAPKAACCQARDGQLVCRDEECSELADAIECTTRSATVPAYCQDAPPGECMPVYLERTSQTTDGAPFQTVFCWP